MDIITKSIDDLLWALRQFRTPESTDHRLLPGYMLWLGAGASVESGIPVAPQLVLRALTSLFIQANRPSLPDAVDPKPIEEWARENLKTIEEWAISAGHFDPYNTTISKYAQIMKSLFPSAGLREQFLRTELRKVKMSVGYRILGELLKRGIFDTIITTNFDHLVRQGADTVLPMPIEEVNAVEQYSRLNLVPTDPRLLRLHGDFWHGNLRNTEDELNETPDTIFEAIKKLFHSYGLVVIGYGGEDINVMQGLFRGLWKDPNTLRNGLYWCDIKPKEDLSPMVRTFLSEGGRTSRAFYVRIEGFDSLLQRLGPLFSINISIEKEMEEAIKQNWEWLALLTDLIDTASADGELLKSPQKQLEQLVKLLGADRALLLSQASRSDDWKVTAASDEPLPALEKNKVAESVHQLHDEDQTYKMISREEMSKDNVFYEFFKAWSQIESFPVWRGDQLIGLVAFASKGQPLIEQQRLRLIRAAVKLLVGL